MQQPEVKNIKILKKKTEKKILESSKKENLHMPSSATIYIEFTLY